MVDPTFGTEESRNDLRFYPPPRYRRRQTVFFTVECKCLHVKRNSGFVHLADLYVKKGLQRFVDGRYSQGLPCGGMVGYVMDNRVEDAFTRVCKEIAKRSANLRMRKKDPLRYPSGALPECACSAETAHVRAGDEWMARSSLSGGRV